MALPNAEPAASEPSVSTVKFASMLKHFIGIFFIHTVKLVFAFGLVLLALFLLLSEQAGVVFNNLGNGFVRPNLANFSFNQMEPLMVFDQGLSWWTRYTRFVSNVLTGNLGLSPIDMAANTPLSELLGFRWIRSILLFGLTMLVAVLFGQRLKQTFHQRTSHQVWACALMSAALPGWALSLAWMFKQMFDDFPPRVGPVESALNANLIPLLISLGVGLFLALGVSKLSKRWSSTQTASLYGMLAAGVFFVGLFLTPSFFGPDTQRVLLDLFRFTALPALILIMTSTALYLVLIRSHFFGSAHQYKPGWGLFLALAVVVQCFVESVFNWRGVGGAFYDISFSSLRWRLIVGAIIGIGLWLLLAHWVRAMIQDTKRISTSLNSPHEPLPLLRFHRDEKLLFLSNALLGVLLVLFVAYPYLSELFSFNSVLERVFRGGLTMFEYAGLAALIATVLGILIRWIAQGFKRLQLDWLSQGLGYLASAWLGMPWLLLVIFWFYLSLPAIGGYPLYQLSLLFGLGFWPVSFFVFQPSQTTSAQRRWVAVFKKTAAAVFLVMGLALTMEMLLGMVGWRPQPSSTWGQEIQNGYINEVVLGIDFRRPFWVAILALSLFNFACYLLALSLRGVGQFRSLP